MIIKQEIEDLGRLNNMKRVITGVILAFLLVGTLLLRNVSLAFFDALIGVLLVIASMEICNAQEKRGKSNIKYLSMLYPIFMYILYVMAINNQYGIWFIILSQALLLLTFAFVAFVCQFIYQLVLNRKSKNKVSAQKNFKNSLCVCLNTFVTFVYPSLFLGLLFVFNHFSGFAFASSNTILTTNIETILIALIFLITFSTDIFAFCVGSVFKGPKLCPLISPKKTISGAIGGIIASVFTLTITFYILNAISAFNSFFDVTGLNLLIFIIVAIIGSIISQLGDIFASLIKRKSGIKDFGTILPGHGGIIDRFDGVIFNTVFVLILSCILLF